MKRYISAILVPCLLLQLLAGCFSYQEITLDELKNYKGTDDIVINRDGNEIALKGDFKDRTTIDWERNDSSSIIHTPKLIRDNGSEILVDMKYDIKYDQIKTIEAEEFDVLKTVGLSAGIIAVVIIVGGLIALSNMHFDFRL